MRSNSYHLNRIFLAAVLVVLLGLALFSGVLWLGSPEIVLESNRVDLGVISNKEPTVTNVVVRNSGWVPLRIQSVSGTCGCVSGVITPNVLSPGAQGTLAIKVFPDRYLGFESEKTLLIQSNATPLTFRVAFKIDPELILDPVTLNMGKIAMGASPSARVLLRQAGNEPIQLKNVTVPDKDPLLGVSFVKIPPEQWKTPNRVEYAVTVNLRADTPSGPFATSFLLEETCKRLPKLRYFVTGEVVAPYHVEPHVLTPGRLVPGMLVSKTIHISADKALEVSDVVAQGGLSAVLKRGVQPNAYEIELKVPSDAKAGFLSTIVVFSVQIDGISYRDRVRVDTVIVSKAS